MSLSSLIVQREVASIRQVEEALARQVLYGGDLVTNLMEVVQIPEKILVPLLAESVGLAAAPVGMLPPPTPQARALVPEDVASRRAVVPLAVEGDRLVLAVSDPLGKDDLDELSFALGMKIEERIAPSVRIREALARVYGVPLERRMARLVGRLAGVDPTGPNSLPPVKAHLATLPPLPGALSHDLPKLNPPGMPVMGTLRFQDSRGGAEEPKAEPAPPPAPRVTTSVTVDARAVLPTLLRETKSSPDVARRRGPVTLERVTDELGQITDREALLHLFFDFGRQFFEYSAIFIVHGDLAEGRDGFGNGASRERVVALGVPLDIPSVLRTVRERGVPLCVQPDPSGLDAVLMGDLRRDVRSRVLVVPLVVRSRVVAFFIADDGASGIDPSAQGEVTTVAALVGREFERLIVRTKLAGFSGEAPAPGPRVDLRRIEPKRRRNAELREAAVHALEQVVTTSLAAPPSPARAGSSPPAARTPYDTIPDEIPDAQAAPEQRYEKEEPPAPAAAPVLHLVADRVLELVVEPADEPAAQPVDRPAAPAVAVSQVVSIEAPPLTAPPSSPSPSPRNYKTLRDFPAVSLAELEVAAREASAREAADAPRDPSTSESREREVAEDEAEEEESPSLRLRRIAGDLADHPPPPQALAVRRPSGQPIPREELDEYGDPIRSSRKPDRTSSRPPPADLRQARLLREIDVLTAQFVHAPPAARVPGAYYARSPQSVRVPPHRPPTSRTHEPLPSVIVDVVSETDRLADAFVANPKDERAEAELLRLGQQAMPSIMRHFPGPITILRDTLDDSWPRVTECGPILRLIAGQRRVALPFVVARTEDQDVETRFWATFLLTELAYVEAIQAVVARLFDDSKRVRRAARLVAHVLGDFAAAPLISELDRIVRDPKATSARRVVTLDALGEMRDPLVVPVLLGALADDDEDVGLAARRALMLVSRQDFGRETKKWVAWWHASASRHRIEWLIDALNHDVPALRRAAGQELKALTEQYFGYYDDLPKKDRERAQQKYRDWWRTEGQTRFQKV